MAPSQLVVDYIATSVSVPRAPPVVKPHLPIKRVYRASLTASGTITVTGAWLAENFSFPSNAVSVYLNSIKVWVPATTTLTGVVSLTDTKSGRSFTDQAALGQPMAAVGMRFDLMTRSTPINTAGTSSYALITATGVNTTIDVSLTYIDA